MKHKNCWIHNKSEATLTGVGFAVIATLLAKGLGFVRELCTASIFGTSALGDAFIVALSIPDILVSGFSTAIATLYIPTFFKIKKEINNEEAVKEFNSSVMLLIFIISIILLSVVELFPRQIIFFFAAGFEDRTIEVAVMLLRIMAISILPIFLGSFFKAYGQLTNKFIIMTLYSCIINATIIIALLFYNPLRIEYLSFSVLLGNLLYAVITYISAKKNSMCFSKKISLKNKYINGMLLGVTPVFISNIIAEINQVIDKNFASRLTQGTISALNYSSKIINLITAILGTAISSVLFSKLSKIASEGNKKDLAGEIYNINCYIIALLMPIMLTLMFFARTIITFLFGHGNFGQESIDITSQSLVFYAIGVVGFNLKAIWVRVYNASLDTKTPAINSAIAVFLNIILNFVFVGILQHKGLALATGLSSIFTDILLIVNYKKTNPYFNIRALIKEVIKILFASVILLPVFGMTRALLGENTYFNIIIIGTGFLVSYIPYIFLLVIMKTCLGEFLIKNIKR